MIDTQYLEARQLMLNLEESIVLHLIGCGGTGSWLAPAVARIGLLLQDKFGKSVSIGFQDPDKVEEKNVFRQNFCYAEIGTNKAATLAARYGHAWGVDIHALTTPFAGFKPNYGQTYVSVGCVDNAAAREAINESRYSIWLDCGNAKNSGQILAGVTPAGVHKKLSLKDIFALEGYCTWLPSPADQHPELLEALPEETRPEGNLSCADLALLDAQGLSINQRIAAEAADFLVKMLITRDLKRYACYLDLESGTTRSLYITPDQLKPYLPEG